MGSSIFDEVFQAVSFAAFDLPGVGGIACGRIANPLAEAQLTAERAVDDALAFALTLALFQWVADIGDADREMARACIALDTLVRFSAARGEPLPPLNADIVENIVPVDFTQREKARAELDAWMQAGIAVTGAKGDNGRVRVRPAEEGEHVIGETMVDASGLQYVKTWAVLIDDPKANP